MKKLFIYYIRHFWPTLIIAISYAILTSLSEFNTNFSWITNIDIWLNAVILELFLFQSMYIITSKIKNNYLQTLISLIISLIIGESIMYSFNPRSITIFTVLYAIFFAASLVISSFQGFKMGIYKVKKEANEIDEKSNQIINSFSEEDKTILLKELDKCLYFAEENPFAYKTLVDTPIDVIKEIKEDIISRNGEANKK